MSNMSLKNVIATYIVCMLKKILLFKVATVVDQSVIVSFWKLSRLDQFSLPFFTFLSSQVVGYPCRSNNEEVEEEFVSLKQSKNFANGNNLSGQVQLFCYH